MSKFYPLEHKEWTEVRQNLKPVEIVVLYHLRTLDPFGDRTMRINVTELATELKINRSTCSRALKTLCNEGYITLQLDTVVVTVKKECDQKSTGVIKKSHSGSKKHTIDQKITQKDQKITEIDQKSTVIPSKATLGEDSEDSKTIKTNKTDQIRSKNENFELKNHEVEVKNDQEIAQETKDDPDKELKKFIIKTVEKQKGIEISNADAYAAKCLEKDRNHWRSLYEESKKTKPKPRDLIAEDIWRLEQSISAAIKMRDYEFARARLPDEFAEQIFEKHPEWRSLLCR
ncbi:transcriptional regulator [Synechococcus sp. PCC 7502]|uniref:MarR family transcriptional regulator n=1 Tax=Synechococcus sp. PCC 7502 TaxID=1173263 RepID=UPI00029F8C7A|nr:helix-turn-helix domain-containing protein [Synechococcus sp. PCC 7502]AFY74754.1 transcriptional regulator [Synechococcus sp. PCC 7502]